MEGCTHNGGFSKSRIMGINEGSLILILQTQQHDLEKERGCRFLGYWTTGGYFGNIEILFLFLGQHAISIAADCVFRKGRPL